MLSPSYKSVIASSHSWCFYKDVDSRDYGKSLVKSRTTDNNDKIKS